MDAGGSFPQFRWRHPGVVSDTVDGVTIAIDLDSGTYYQFSRDASCILECLPGFDSQTVHEESQREQAMFFLQELVGIGLLEESTSDAEPTSVRSFSGDGFSYETFTDLAHILMLDPIHDVDPPMGWPHADAPAT